MCQVENVKHQQACSYNEVHDIEYFQLTGVCDNWMRRYWNKWGRLGFKVKNRIDNKL